MGRKKKVIQQTKVITIVHGQSEYVLCSHVKSNLRIKHEIIYRDKGKTSIQVNGLVDLLSRDRRLKSRNSLKREFPDIDLENFKLFIIMDVDDCNSVTKEKFKNKELFKDFWLYPHIVPIYNEPKLEKTMEDIGITIQHKKEYITIFPTSHGDLDLDIAKDFYEKLKTSRHSNLHEYVKFCVECCEENLKT